MEAWIIQGLDVYDQSGLYAAVDVFKNVDKFLERARIAKVGTTLEEHSAVLERVVLGLSGRRLRLEAAETIYTDTETLYLPATACRFDSREDNFHFLKAAAAYLWAQTRFGTWQARVIEALRGEEKWLKKEPYGDEVDIDALVEAHADAHRGLEMSDRLFARLDRVERNIAVMFMVDMSGSTRGWINKAERESLLLLCEALETLGDRYAIYGFSGMTRKRCETYRIKGFDEAYGEEVRGRIAGIEAKDYTRMGAAIRHLSEILNRVEARTRILITLSDGKPDDYSDEYRSEYGVEDTRRALIEAKRGGIHPFCITIDREGQDYLPHMYGAVNYTIVDEVAKLPYKISEIYRRLTV